MTNDYELVYLAQENNEEARNILHEKYSKLINSLINKTYKKYSFITTEIDDLKLECKIIFDNAINNYNQDKDAKFFTYAKLCIEAKIIDIIKSSLTKKSRIENNMISLDDDTDGVKKYDTIYEYKKIINNNYIDIETFVKNINLNLSIHEKDVLKLLLKGKNKKDISLLLNIDLKKINNTIYRLKTKIKKELY